MSTRVTLRDIAKEANVHFTTVGLALRNSQRISAATREKVWATAKRMGYQPDPMLTALNAYRRKRFKPQFQAAIAWINNWPVRSELYKNADFYEFYQGAVERARELGYEITEFWLGENNMTMSNLERVFRARNIKGVIFAPQPHAGIQLDTELIGLSAVSLSYSLSSPSLHFIANHHARSMRLLLTKLEGLGYRRIGLELTRDLNEKAGLNWLSGVLISREVILNKAIVIPIKEDFSDIQGLYRAIKKEKLDVFISHARAYDALCALGVRFPEDLGFANFSVEYNALEVSGIYENSHHIGYKSVDFVVDMLHRNETGIPDLPIHFLVDSVWNPGTTLREAKKSRGSTTDRAVR